MFPLNTVRVITPNPNSRDHTRLESPDFALFDNFGLIRSRTPSVEWDNYTEDPSFTDDQEWVRQRLGTSTDANLLDRSVCELFVDIPLDSSEAESEAEAEMESLNREVLRINNVRSNLMRRMKMYTPDDVTLDTVDEVGIEL